MATPALLKLKHKDVGALSVFCLLGILVGCFISDTTWSIYTSFLVADHLFLGWLAFMSGEGVRRSIPIFATIAIHMAFVILVVLLIAVRHSIPHFGLLPFAVAPVAFWLLSSAAGYEEEDDFEVPVAVRKSRLTEKREERQTKEALLGSRLAMRNGRVSADTWARLDRPKNAQSIRPPAKEPHWPVPSRRAQAASAGIGSHRSAAAEAAPAQAEMKPANLDPESKANDFAAANIEGQPEWALKVLQVLAAAAASEAHAAPEPALAQPAANGNGAPSTIATAAPQPAAKPNGTRLAALSNPPQPATNGNGARLAPVVSYPQPELVKNGHKPSISGVELSTEKPVAVEPAPALYHDTEIANSLRRSYSEEDLMLNPLLAASAEEHEEWLVDRTTFNPTHRKPGTSVKEQYEQWLRTRNEVQVGDTAAGQSEAVQ